MEILVWNTLLDHTFFLFFLPTRAPCTVISCQNDRVKLISQKLRRWWKSAMYIFLNRSFIAKIYVFPIYFLTKISHDTCQSNLRVLWRRAWTTSYGLEMRTWNNKGFSGSSTSVYGSSVILGRVWPTYLAYFIISSVA